MSLQSLHNPPLSAQFSSAEKSSICSSSLRRLPAALWASCPPSDLSPFPAAALSSACWNSYPQCASSSNQWHPLLCTHFILLLQHGLPSWWWMPEIRNPVLGLFFFSLASLLRNMGNSHNETFKHRIKSCAINNRDKHRGIIEENVSSFLADIFFFCNIT